MERMPRIAVCDDDKFIHDRIYELLFTYSKQHPEEQMLFSAFDSADALMNYKDNVDLLFLDIELQDATGIDLVPKLKEKAPDITIIFISSHTKYVIFSHRLNVFQFLTKPFDDGIFFEELDRFYTRYHLAQDLYTIQSKGETIQIPICEIAYIESNLRHLKIYHSKTGLYEISGQISKEEQKLAEYGFMRCHHGFLVNPRYIESIKGQSIYLTTLQTIPISRNKLQSVKQQYQKWLQAEKV